MNANEAASTRASAAASRGETPVRRRDADRKSQLVAIARDLLLRDGYTAMSMADIAAAAGVTAPSLYRHFADKQSIVAAAVHSSLDHLEHCTTSALGADVGSDGLPRTTPAPQHDRSRDRDALLDHAVRLATANPAGAVVWRWNTAYLTDADSRDIGRRAARTLRTWCRVLLADRHLSEADQMVIAWSVVCALGSTSARRPRLPVSAVRAELRLVVDRILAATPAAATGLRVPTATPELRESRRDDILDAAAELFRIKGYAGVAMGEIGDAVGMTGPSLYRHFASKQEILLTMCHRSAEQITADAATVRIQYPEARQQLSHLIDRYVWRLTSHSDLLAAFLNSQAVTAGSTSLLTSQRNYVRTWVELLVQIWQDELPPYDETAAPQGAATADPAAPQRAATADPAVRERAAIAVHAALTIANDAMRVRGNWDRDGFPELLAYLMHTALGLPRTG